MKNCPFCGSNEIILDIFEDEESEWCPWCGRMVDYGDIEADFIDIYSEL